MVGLEFWAKEYLKAEGGFLLLRAVALHAHVF